MAKSYKDLTPKEKYDSALEADKADWNPAAEARKLVREKLGMDNENMSKGIELKAGKPSSKKPYELKPEAKKKGGKVKCMARGGGIEVRGKTRGKIC